MNLLYSNVPPLVQDPETYNLRSYFLKQLESSNMICIASGYASRRALLDLDSLIHEYCVSKTVLVLGMYCIEGFPESIYNTVKTLNDKWSSEGIGEIRATSSMKYHGKVYGFYQQGSLFSGIVGSHNLSALVSDAGNLRQYEMSTYTEDPDECALIASHLSQLISSPISTDINQINPIKLIREENSKMTGVEGVEKISIIEVKHFSDSLTDISFEIPLKVPGIPSSTRDYMKSNINKCYAKGRLNSRTGVVTERGWWETEVIVSSETTSHPNYPERDTPFFVVTDDGYRFKMHVSGDYKKNLESDKDLKILGYWLKGRLVAAGIIDPIDSPSQDLLATNDNLTDKYQECKGVITFQKLLHYGRTSLTLSKTTEKIRDEENKELDVWLLSFLPE